MVCDRLKPWRDRFPALADLKCHILDGTIETLETGYVFAVVKRGTGLCESLMGEGILEPLNFAVAFKIEILDLSVLSLYSSIKW